MDERKGGREREETVKEIKEKDQTSCYYKHRDTDMTHIKTE
jgi:hypothetical protein